MYRREVDGLRALAVLPVIFYHAGFAAFSGGFVGVDVFFVISGYLITSILLQDIDAGSFSLVRFYERRARRILPALFLVMTACLPAAWLLLPPADMKDFAQSLLAVALYLSNVLFWQESGYFAASAELKPLLHTWSLAIEEQFYLLFPLLLLALWRRGQPQAIGALLLMAAASMSLAELWIGRQPEAAFFLLPSRAWELIVGALVAIWLHREPVVLATSGRLRHAVNEALSLAGLVLLVGVVFLVDKNTHFPGVGALWPTVGTALVILCARPTNLTGRLLAHRLPVGIGLISYSAYLWHQPLFAFARRASLGELGATMALGLVLLTLGLAVLSWRFVEQPFRARNKVGKRGLWWFAGAGTIIFPLIGATGHLTQGFERQRTTPEQLKLMETAISSPMRARCHASGSVYLRPANACELNSGTPSWAVFGDSHAVELAYTLAEELRPSGRSLKHLSFSGCAPAYRRSSEVPGCQAWTEEALEYLVGASEIRTVVVAYRLAAALQGGHEGIYPRVPDQFAPAQRDATWQSYRAMIERLTAAGKQVYVVLQAPELAKPIDQLIFTHASATSIAGSPRVWWDQRTQFVRARLSELPGEVRVVDPAQHWCDAVRCFATLDGEALYFDDDHPSVAGSRRIARQLLAFQK